MTPRARYLWAAGLVAALAAGSVLRLAWLADVEFKGDEAWMFNAVRDFWVAGKFPLVGMPSSVGVPNAGLSVWSFIGLGAFVPLDSPLPLTRAVQCVNVVALLLLAAFAWRGIPREEREPWLWAAALTAVNPLSVLFSRKIWAQDLLPVLTLGLVAGWWFRGRWWGAFLWGVTGALAGQIHLSGFFFAAAFVLATLIYRRRDTRWRAWLAGSLLGAVPMLPWLLAVIESPGVTRAPEWINLVPWFLLHWLSMASGVELHYSLGHSFVDFLRGGGTYIPAAVSAVVAVSMALALTWRRRPWAGLVDLRSDTTLAIAAAFWGYGLLLTLTLRDVYLHYEVIAFFFPALWLASATRSRTLLVVIACSQAVLSALFLSYIHDVQVIAGDYGTAYGAQ